MKALALLFALGVACAAFAQVVLTPVNRDVLVISGHTNTLSTSNALQIVSGLRLGMATTEIDSYLNAHGMTNSGSLSLDRGEHFARYYDFPGTDSRLVLETRGRRTGPDIRDWGYHVLESGRIERLSVTTFQITFTNVP